MGVGDCFGWVFGFCGLFGDLQGWEEEVLWQAFCSCGDDDCLRTVMRGDSSWFVVSLFDFLSSGCVSVYPCSSMQIRIFYQYIIFISFFGDEAFTFLAC